MFEHKDMEDKSQKEEEYLDSGREEANSFVDSIKQKCTHDTIGGFASLLELPSKYGNPMLVTATDGVGTKIQLAILMNNHYPLGIDLVAMCVNDLICCGADPLLFLDYYATGKLKLTQGEEIIDGILAGCSQAGCYLAGGETAEMPGFYQQDKYDLAGFAVGIVSKNNVIKPKGEEGSIVIGLSSSGVHANGFSLIRHLMKTNRLKIDQPYGEHTLGEELLKPTKIYVKTIDKLKKANIDLLGIAHITGGGISENLPRALPSNCGAVIDFGGRELPELFKLIHQASNMSLTEFYSTFNAGIGMAVIVSPQQESNALEILSTEGAYTIGKLCKGTSEIIYK